MRYNLYSIFITVICLFVIYRLVVLIKEKNEAVRIDKEIKRNNYKLQVINKNLYYLLALAKQKGGIKQYFNNHQINSVAVYGMDEVGKMCIQLFMDAGVNVCYGIDKSKNIVFEHAQIRQAENIDDQADIIIVAVEMYFNEIKDSIKSKVLVCKLSEVLEEILMISCNY